MNSIVKYMKSEAIVSRFLDVIGDKKQALGFINEVLVAVETSESEKLRACTPQSIYVSAMRAATLRLSLDKSKKQAYLVPYGNKAVFQPSWKGLYDMAMRTGKYRYINTAEIEAGKTVVIDEITGAASVEFEDGAEGGWVASFQLMERYGGMSKVVYMTHSEIQAHKEKYAKGFNRRDSAWNTALRKMERKTVLRQLLMSWGVFDDNESAILEAISDIDNIDTSDAPNPEDVVDAEFVDDEFGEDISQDEFKKRCDVYKFSQADIDAAIDSSGGRLDVALDALIRAQDPAKQLGF